MYAPTNRTNRTNRSAYMVASARRSAARHFVAHCHSAMLVCSLAMAVALTGACVAAGLGSYWATCLGLALGAAMLGCLALASLGHWLGSLCQARAQLACNRAWAALGAPKLPWQ